MKYVVFRSDGSLDQYRTKAEMVSYLVAEAVERCQFAMEVNPLWGSARNDKLRQLADTLGYALVRKI